MAYLRFTRFFLVVAFEFVVFTLIVAAVARAQDPLEAPPLPDDPAFVDLQPLDIENTPDAEVLTRGQLHEAFASPVEHDPMPSDIVPQEPPQPIDELPPEMKPAGENVEWIPGYWMWDADRDDYVWVSGVWRAVPPGREWVSGYWDNTEGGFRWVSGYWGDVTGGDRFANPNDTNGYDSRVAAAQPQAEYLPTPPTTLEAGPTSPAPTQEHFWVPGCWLPGDFGYRWRPGYWHNYRANWVWIPDRYVWTPRGCLFVAGYWDRTLQFRGQCFAPVYFSRLAYSRPHIHYRPHVALSLANLSLHLFVGPRATCYYYGDYYGSSYLHRGFRPWYDVRHIHHRHHHGYRRHYDPLISYYNVHFNRHGIDYVHRLKGWNNHFTRHVDHRPHHSFSKPRKAVVRNGHGHRNSGPAKYGVIAHHVNEAAKVDRGRKFNRVVVDELARQKDRANRLRQQAHNRAVVEKQRLPAGVGNQGPQRRAVARGQNEAPRHRAGKNPLILSRGDQATVKDRANARRRIVADSNSAATVTPDRLSPRRQVAGRNGQQRDASNALARARETAQETARAEQARRHRDRMTRVRQSLEQKQRETASTRRAPTAVIRRPDASNNDLVLKRARQNATPSARPPRSIAPSTNRPSVVTRERSTPKPSATTTPPRRGFANQSSTRRPATPSASVLAKQRAAVRQQAQRSSVPSSPRTAPTPTRSRTQPQVNTPLRRPTLQRAVPKSRASSPSRRPTSPSRRPTSPSRRPATAAVKPPSTQRTNAAAAARAARLRASGKRYAPPSQPAPSSRVSRPTPRPQPRVNRSTPAPKTRRAPTVRTTQRSSARPQSSPRRSVQPRATAPKSKMRTSPPRRSFNKTPPKR